MADCAYARAELLVRRGRSRGADAVVRACYGDAEADALVAAIADSLREARADGSAAARYTQVGTDARALAQALWTAKDALGDAEESYGTALRYWEEAGKPTRGLEFAEMAAARDARNDAKSAVAAAQDALDRALGRREFDAARALRAAAARPAPPAPPRTTIQARWLHEREEIVATTTWELRFYLETDAPATDRAEEASKEWVEGSLGTALSEAERHARHWSPKVVVHPIRYAGDPGKGTWTVKRFPPVLLVWNPDQARGETVPLPEED